jgi:hypothetical protein
LAPLEIVDWSMTSPAPIEAPVQVGHSSDLVRRAYLDLPTVA